MIRINLTINIDKPKWWYKIFPCEHEVVHVEENFDSKYGTHTSYIYCLKCGRQAGDIEKNCKHDVNFFGTCNHCLARIKYPCKENHKWTREPDTDDYFCDKCGEWKDEF